MSLKRTMATLIALVLSGTWAASAAAQPQAPQLPQVSQRLPVTQTSYPFSAADHQEVPLDLARFGYVEDEYLVSGEARVFDWPRADGPTVLGKGPYTTRILVRRPKDRARFNGTVIVEPMNPSADVDLPIMWAESYRQMLADGFVWVGVTIKPNTIKALRAFDSARYAQVGMPNPRPGSTCAADRINPSSQPTTVADETGLAWDMLSQIGALLKSRSKDNPVPWPVARLYMTGQSQTAGYARTYASVFAREVAAPDGGPLYDAYLYSGSPPWQVPLNQCREDLAAGDPRLITPAVGVPVIEIFTQGDMGTNIETRRPDADGPSDRFRRYEVAGAPHVDPWEGRSFANQADMARAGMRDNTEIEKACQPAGVVETDFPTRYVFDAAWKALDRWVRSGVPAPRGAPLQLKPADGPFNPDQGFVTDEVGNAVGGVRSPYVDVPTARWVGAKTGPFVCLFQGYKHPLDTARLKRLYPTAGAYVAKVRKSTAALQVQGWLTGEGREEIDREARRFQAP